MIEDSGCVDVIRGALDISVNERKKLQEKVFSFFH